MHFPAVEFHGISQSLGQNPVITQQDAEQFLELIWEGWHLFL
jgi:hypothetical protein